jgi:hypothetical protein
MNDKYTAAKRNALPAFVRDRQLAKVRARSQRKKARRAERDAKAEEDAIVSAMSDQHLEDPFTGMPGGFSTVDTWDSDASDLGDGLYVFPSLLLSISKFHLMWNIERSAMGHVIRNILLVGNTGRKTH